jgi:hypothetical protein
VPSSATSSASTFACIPSTDLVTLKTKVPMVFCDGGGGWWLPEITWYVVCVLLLESTQFVWQTGGLEGNEPSSGHPHGVYKQGLKPP